MTSRRAAERRRKYRPRPITITNLYDPSVHKVCSVKRGTWTEKKGSAKRHKAKRDLLSRLGFDSYTDYLQSNRWHSKRQEMIRSGRGSSCISCGTPKKLHIHHRTYKRIGNESLDDLDPLCKRCHELAHRAAEALPGITLWNCSREVANLIRLEFGTPRFDHKAWNKAHTKRSNIARAKGRHQDRRDYASAEGGPQTA